MKPSTLLVAIFVTLLFVSHGFGKTRVEHVDTGKLLWEGMQAQENGRVGVAKDKFRRVLKWEPLNYQALVRLTQIEMDDLPVSSWNRMRLQWENALLLAAISQAHRPEAYLLLAQLCYKLDEIRRADYYVKEAQVRDPSSPEAYSLVGQRYENSGNYIAALMEYSRALSYHPSDPYFLNRRYIAASQLKSTDWITQFAPYNQLEELVDAMGPELAPRLNYNMAEVKNLIYRIERDGLLRDYRTLADAVVSFSPDYELPPFKFRLCSAAKMPESRYSDLYEAFIKASVKDPAKYRRLRAKLDKIRKEALKEVAKLKDSSDKERAKALYNWLKSNVLKNYHIEEGVAAEQVLDDNKYLCHTGAVLYTLIAGEAGLPVYGVITPGHTFAILDDGRRDVQIELTAEPMFGTSRDDGFDVDWWTQFKQLNRVNADGGLRAADSYRNIGKVEPKELTAYQFANIFLTRRKESLKELKDLQESLEFVNADRNRLYVERAAELASIKNTSVRDADEYNSMKEAVQAKYSRLINDVEDRMVKARHALDSVAAKFELSRGRTLIREARSLAPLNEELIGQGEAIYLNKAAADRMLVERELQKRAQEQLRIYVKKRLSTMNLGRVTKKKGKTLLQKISELEEAEKEKHDVDGEARSEWNKEKEAWLSSVATLDEGLNEFPCSRQLLRRLESVCSLVAHLAKENGDYETLNKLLDIGMKRFPDSRFVARYSEVGGF